MLVGSCNDDTILTGVYGLVSLYSKFAVSMKLIFFLLYSILQLCAFYETKPLSMMLKGLSVQAPPARQNDFRTFCMSDEIEKVYHRLEEALSIY